MKQNPNTPLLLFCLLQNQHHTFLLQHEKPHHEALNFQMQDSVFPNSNLDLPQRGLWVLVFLHEWLWHLLIFLAPIFVRHFEEILTSRSVWTGALLKLEYKWGEFV